MAASPTISIGFKIEDGKDGLKNLVLDANALKKVMSATVNETEKLNKKFINFAAIATGIDSFNSTLSNIKNTVSDLTGAYAAQIEVETQLASNMRNSMDATDEQIQSIKDLCSAQQQLGVIGDEVQLAGAQELATYLTTTSTLKKLIPVLNDMTAQQYGYNATQEASVNIATMLGKVMNGQTGALKRYGYSFDEAQEKILKTGTEAERCAVLFDVVTSSVGGTNKALRETPYGVIKALSNTMGDWKENMGALVAEFEPLLTVFFQLGFGISGFVKLAAGVKTATQAIKTFAASNSYGTTNLRTFSLSAHKAAIAQRVFAASGHSAAKAAIAFKLALRGILVSTGIGAALTVITYALIKFSLAANDAADASDRLLTAEERAAKEAERLNDMREEEESTLTNARAALELNITKLKEFNGTKEQEKKLVNEMNNTYGETMGYFSSVADWYKALVSNSEAYCKQMIIEARTRILAKQIAEKKQDIHNIVYDKEGNPLKYSKNKRTEWKDTDNYVDFGGYLERVKEKVETTSPWEDAVNDIRKYQAEIRSLNQQMADAVKEAAGITFNVTGSDKRPEGDSPVEKQVKAAAGSIKELEERISKLKASYSLEIDEQSRIKLMSEIKKLESEKHVIEMRVQGIIERPKSGTSGVTKFDASPYVERPQDLPFVEVPESDLPKRAEDIKKLNEQLMVSQQVTGGLSDAFGTLGNAIKGTTGEMLNYISTFLGSASQMFAAIMALTAGHSAESAAQTPIIGWLNVGTAIASTLAAFASIPKFANGGIISGPTVGLMGEYAGASNNPEVVAPLDKLRNLLQPAGVTVNGEKTIRLVASGRELSAVINLENLLNRRR